MANDRRVSPVGTLVRLALLGYLARGCYNFISPHTTTSKPATTSAENTIDSKIYKFDSIPAPTSAPTKRLQDRWMRYGDWNFVRVEPDSNYRKDEIGHVNLYCDAKGCSEMLVDRRAFDTSGNYLSGYVSVWTRRPRNASNTGR